MGHRRVVDPGGGPARREIEGMAELGIPRSRRMATRTMRCREEKARDVGYPRPQLRRPQWTCLDGPWDFALDPGGRWRAPEHVDWEGKIFTPYAPETRAGGVGETGFFQACWYRRDIDPPPLGPDQRLLLHFGAVDYAATVWVNGSLAVRHEGGYTPFSADITDLLVSDRPNSIAVRAEDDPHDLAKPR